MSEQGKKEGGDMLSKLNLDYRRDRAWRSRGLVMGKPAHMFAPIGDLFMQLIKMVVIPMVFFSLVGGASARWAGQRAQVKSVL